MKRVSKMVARLLTVASALALAACATEPDYQAAPVSPSAAAPAAPVARQRTWQGVGGYVTAQCRGTDISLVAAQPDAGFVIAVSDRGPDALEASFAGREREHPKT